MFVGHPNIVRFVSGWGVDLTCWNWRNIAMKCSVDMGVFHMNVKWNETVTENGF